GGTENMIGLLIFIGVKLCDIPVSDFGVDEIPSPVVIPQYGIYHPDAKAEAEGIQGLGIFSSIDDYLTWYKSTGRFNESAPTIGIHYYYVSGKYGSYKTLDPLIRKIEDKGANVIFASFSYKDPNTTTYFLKDGKPLVDSVIILNSFRLWHHHEDEGIGYLQQLNVTPIKGIMSYYMNETVWNERNGLSPSEVAWQVALPELDGETEFILFSGKEKDPVSGEYCYRPFDYQLEWITDRAISWAELHRKSNAEKKVAIIYYNHGGGKDNLGASYLDIVPSLTNLLDAMKAEGYDVKGEVPSEDELLDLMLHQGRNVGTWAPDELERMVESGTVILLPASEYETWFNELPEDKQEEVIEKWGEPPGEIMVYENETGEYLVIPGVKLGNVLLAPQPTRGWLQDQAILYHDKELPPHHQYIAFYLWLKKEYGADAIVHFGTHGTQEWLPGKETALSAEEDWPRDTDPGSPCGIPLHHG
ncbi:MAG TPA: cobaltochelatase subunit CobN, partial [Candidatus Syntrophoarchaeum butanivorans]|nr:cobaltochelatase subunit CobN [Candidatus Syntrophoarchaeum butanivorans]